MFGETPLRPPQHAQRVILSCQRLSAPKALPLGLLLMLLCSSLPITSPVGAEQSRACRSLSRPLISTSRKQRTCRRRPPCQGLHDLEQVQQNGAANHNRFVHLTVVTREQLFPPGLFDACLPQWC